MSELTGSNHRCHAQLKCAQTVGQRFAGKEPNGLSFYYYSSAKGFASTKPSAAGTLVTSGVPQGSVLGPLLFHICINDLDSGIVNKISKFADDTKLCHRSRQTDEVLELQEDLTRLVDWANTYQMNFNIDKCSVMNIGHNNIHHNNTMANQQLIATEEQRDLGIKITRVLMWQKQPEKNVVRQQTEF